MRVIASILVAATCLAVAGVGRADSVKTLKSTIPGQITEMDPEKVVLRAIGDKTIEVPVNEIQTIFFDTDPTELRTAKTYVLTNRFAEAQAALERIKDDVTGRPENEQDVEFYKAICAAKLALAGTGKIADAGRLMKAFADKNTKSYHYYEASETVGDLLVAIREYALAAEYYARLEKAPWPDYKMRAGVAAGRALLAQGKINEAQSAFDRVVATEAEGELAQSPTPGCPIGQSQRSGCLEETRRGH